MGVAAADSDLAAMCELKQLMIKLQQLISEMQQLMSQPQHLFSFAPQTQTVSVYFVQCCLYGNYILSFCCTLSITAQYRDINIKIQIKCLAWNLGLQRFGLGSCQSKTEGKLGCDVKIACFFPTKVWKCWGTFNCGVSQSTSSLESKVY